ncbi:glucose-1-phosphate adenylyltransferase [Bradymonadaceae bacterium TMQ3]|uniref:Glucose-1-phosphate adenylyltransferase n=1 Tax=Lujinxingia sediminis TaxID=2480984 RepID=A0ABY0CUT3_9DELT|nr:glucose-1-phosphate adenylyltransferase [Lujinxingia sediminis]RDV38549.1 glucose-1-phosphate adenylyltransferase [Bradymonadaceae bacterium TMQ3]RVU44904.1 glucose-1-phosphate adenylyltransferase [Lujinxingia sediminis]TXC76683.1 glucose-1-phosphate adenylyltransferase [Bradymonadales bacterium TMQ1]
MNDVLVMILAGGEGKRLRPLTLDRAKPAVPFGGRYRIIDLVLSNFVNSGFYKIKVLTQYKSDSLINHISRGWHLAQFIDHYIDAVPAQQRRGPQWFQGSADAIYQNLNLIYDEEPADVCVFGGDNIYKMDVRQMLDFHRRKDADLTVAAIPVPVEQGRAFGILEIDRDHRIVGFAEKPEEPREIPGRPGWCLASMGNYIFKTPSLVEELIRDAHDEGSAHDFGKNIITNMVRSGHQATFVYDFSTNDVPGQSERERSYWRDVGTIDAYWESSMDLISVAPEFDLYNRRWPIRTHYQHYPPAKFVHDDPAANRVGQAINSIVAEGCIVSGGTIRNSVLFQRVRVNSYSSIEDSVLFEQVEVGRRARIRKAIIEKDVVIPPDTVIGFDEEQDRARFPISDAGVVVVPKGYEFEA